MAGPFHFPVTAAQVGTYFVGQYYQVLQQQPEFVHQFYSDISTSLRIDGSIRETASSMLHIHTLVMSSNYSAIEIKSAHSLESWNRGILVMVTGSVHVKDFSGKRDFVQTFFLAPQDNGYFVLNDIFQFIDDEHIVQHPVDYSAQSKFDAKPNTSAIQEHASSFSVSNDFALGEYMETQKAEENGPLDDYSFPEEHLQGVHEAEKNLDDYIVMQSNGSVQSVQAPLQDHMSNPVEEAVEEPQKHTYASIVAKAPTAQAVHSQYLNKAAPSPSEWQNVSEPSFEPSIALSNNYERPGTDAFEEASAGEDEFEVKSVYVKNVPTTMIPSEIETEFMKFGKLVPGGVAIRTRKDIDICYAFVEFEDVTGVQNAIKASSVQIGGHQLYIEGRRPNRGIPIRGRGRGRGRSSSYQMEGTRGRFGGRAFGRGNNQDANEGEYHRPRGNGYYRQAPLRQDKVYSSSQQGQPRNGQNTPEWN